MDSLKLNKTLISDEMNALLLWKKPQVGSYSVVGVTIAWAELLTNYGLARSPAVFTELVMRELDRLKAFIGNQLLAYEDGDVRCALELAADYLQQHSFRVTMWGIFPLDGKLVLTLAGLCTTHLILIAQTTGLI